MFYRRRTALTRHQFGGLIAAAARDLNPAVITRDIAIIESGAVTVWYSRFVPARKRGPGV